MRAIPEIFWIWTLTVLTGFVHLDRVHAQESASESGSVSASVIDRKMRTQIFLGVGNLALKGNSGSVLAEDYSSGPGVQFGLGLEFPLSARGSFETGVSILGLGSELKAASESKMSLSYLVVPLVYKYEISKVNVHSGFFLRGGLLPMMLLHASVDTCSSYACGLDHELDEWLAKSRSISSSFQRYNLAGTAGGGFNFLLFRDFIIDSLWLNLDLTYVQSLTKINRGNELGRDVKMDGFLINTGLAVSF